MRAFVVVAPRQYEVRDVAVAKPSPGEAVVDVERVGVCGTDVEFFNGEMVYLEQGYSTYPIRLGHEWTGTVVNLGEGVDRRWLGRRVIGDTMIGEGTCRRCRRGHQHLCERRLEVGIRDGCPGALADQVAVPVRSLHELPDSVDAVMGALVEPGGTALRAAHAAQTGGDDRVLVVGPGAIGSLAALFLRAAGARVEILGSTESSLDFVRALGFTSAWTNQSLPDEPFDAVVDATNDADLPARGLDLVEPGGRLVTVGLGDRASYIDTRTLTLKDVTAVGVMSASPALDDTIAAYARGLVDPRPLVAATVGLDEVGSVLAGVRPAGATTGPKIHVDPRIRSEG